MRNRALKLEVLLILRTIVVGIGGFIANEFRMNLLSGLDEHPQACWIASGRAVLSSVHVFGDLIKYLRCKGIFS